VLNIPTFFSIINADTHNVDAMGCAYMLLELDFWFLKDTSDPARMAEAVVRQSAVSLVMQSEEKKIKQELLVWEFLLYIFYYKIDNAVQLVDSIAEFSASLELGNLLCSDSNLLLGSRIDALTSGLLSNSESTETNELDLVTLYESVLDSCYSSVQSLLCVNFCQTSTCCNLIDQFCFVHNFVVLK
jgi:hypothetical protein